MACGQRCKEIIDAGHALIRSVGCMHTSVLLTAEHGPGPDKALMDAYMESARKTAELAQQIALGLNPYLAPP